LYHPKSLRKFSNLFYEENNWNERKIRLDFKNSSLGKEVGLFTLKYFYSLVSWCFSHPIRPLGFSQLGKKKNSFFKISFPALSYIHLNYEMTGRKFP